MQAPAYCPRCGKWWKPGSVSCMAPHLGSGCCHYGDTEAPAPDLVTWRPPPPGSRIGMVFAE